MDVMWECMWGEMWRRADAGHAGHGGLREVWVFNSKQKEVPLEAAEFGEGQHACIPALQDGPGESQTFCGLAAHAPA